MLSSYILEGEVCCFAECVRKLQPCGRGSTPGDAPVFRAEMRIGTGDWSMVILKEAKAGAIYSHGTHAVALEQLKPLFGLTQCPVGRVLFDAALCRKDPHERRWVRPDGSSNFKLKPTPEGTHFLVFEVE